MSKVYQYVIEKVLGGQIEKKVGADIIHLLKQEEKTRIHEDIAIIGVSVRLPQAEDIGEFWKVLCNGADCIGEFPDSREKELEPYIDYINNIASNRKYKTGAYLDEIGNFDFDFFHLSPVEGKLMDPCQRLFLQVAWNAVEEGGYGGGKLSGQKVGVFVGHSSDFGIAYKRIIEAVNPSLAGIAAPGNIESIIASRISYILDLKGPSMLVDTACSSALTAVHLACRSMKDKECEMAIAGGIKLNIIPDRSGAGSGIGIESSIGKARTFDDSSDGTGFGEGAVAILLKPLKKAVEDGDYIHAVIKGSAVNQDGNSIGITAPNPMAQRDIIVSAWRDAGIDPSTIAYIEAHGTGTSLGDPIEVDGIESAFREFTDRRQFCAVGSVKTNIGHLDNAAGIAGLLKAMLALKNAKIPPSLHFNRPNRKIAFENSPVFINDRLISWESEGFPRRCGISSFGLSGTNCHVILEEAPAADMKRLEAEKDDVFILPVSAQNEDALLDLLKKYREWILDKLSEPDSDEDLEDICYTAGTGRGHYSYRLAVVFDGSAELRDKFNSLDLSGMKPHTYKGVYCGRHRLVTGQRESKSENDITDEEKRQLDHEAHKLLKEIADCRRKPGYKTALEELARLYVKGANVNWEELYMDRKTKKVSLPVYPFTKKQCWVEPQIAAPIAQKTEKTMQHPLFDRCLLETIDTEVYGTGFNIERHWVLSEHKVSDIYVVPGTTYVEMAREAGSKYYRGSRVHLKDIVFLEPLIVNPGETKETHTIVKTEGDYHQIIIASKSQKGSGWTRHAEITACGINPDDTPPGRDIAAIRRDISGAGSDDQGNASALAIGSDIYGSATAKEVVTGPRFKNLEEITSSTDEVLARLVLTEKFRDDLNEYHLHPALMDSAVNMVNPYIGDGLYLPLSYKSLRLYGSMPPIIYSYLKRTKGKANAETAAFDITLMDENGRVFADIEGYTVKKVHQNILRPPEMEYGPLVFHEVGWIPCKPDDIRELPLNESILLFKDDLGMADEIAIKLKGAGHQVVEIETGTDYCKKDSSRFVIGKSEDDYEKLFAEFKGKKISTVLHLMSLTKSDVIQGVAELEDELHKGVYSLFHLIRAIISNKISGSLNVYLVANHVNEVIKGEAVIHPQHAAMFGLAKVVGVEYEHIQCRCIDVDDRVTAEEILKELEVSAAGDIAYRNGIRLIQEFREISLKDTIERKINISKDGVYVITGGTGGLGLEVAAFLAGKGRVNLSLISRSGLPERESWEGILENGKDKKLCHKIKTVLQIEKTGSEVACYSADATSMETMGAVIGDLRSKYGRINGLFHCAGVAGDGFIIKKDIKTFNEVIAPKALGTYILDRLTECDKPDFFILFSSMNTLYGIKGQGDYTAANAFLNAYASYGAARGKNMKAILWPAWSETGMAADYGAVSDETLFKPITTGSALKALEKVMETESTAVIPGRLNIKTLLSVRDVLPMKLSSSIQEQLDQYSDVGKSVRNMINTPQTIRKVILKGRSKGNYAETEYRIAGIWSRILEVEEIDVFDNFNSMGGNSILATRLMREMEQEFSGLVDISDIFTYPTIAQMSEYLKPGLGSDDFGKSYDEADDMGDILIRLAKGEISPDDADKFIRLED